MARPRLRRRALSPREARLRDGARLLRLAEGEQEAVEVHQQEQREAVLLRLARADVEEVGLRAAEELADLLREADREHEDRGRQALEARPDPAPRAGAREVAPGAPARAAHERRDHAARERAQRQDQPRQLVEQLLEERVVVEVELALV